jgi:hypothetical protein
MKGEVQYVNHSVSISPDKLDDKFREQLRSEIEAVGGDLELPKVPSYAECRFCDITKEDCPDRIEDEPKTVDTNMF